MNNLMLVIDMDEVLTDLSDTIRLIVNKDFNKNYPKGFNQNYWWEDYKIEKSYFESLLNEEGLFLNLKPIEGAIETLTKLNEEGFDIHILTCPQYTNGNCFISKVKWIKEYLPFINIQTHFHTTGNKGLFAKEGRLILDDNVSYLDNFQKNGGISVAFDQGWNKDFQGHRVYNWNQFYNLVHLLNNKEPNIDVDRFRNYMRGSHNE